MLVVRQALVAVTQHFQQLLQMVAVKAVTQTQGTGPMVGLVEEVRGQAAAAEPLQRIRVLVAELLVEESVAVVVVLVKQDKQLVQPPGLVLGAAMV